MKLRISLIVVVIAALAVDVAWAGRAPTARVRPALITYGDNIVLRGTVRGAGRGSPAEVLAHACGFTKPIVIATVKVGKRGSVRYSASPTLNTVYFIRGKGRTSRGARLQVAPGVSLRKTAESRYQVEVSSGGGSSFEGKSALLQRRAGSRWVKVAAIPLKLTSDATALTAVSSGSATASVPRKSTLRAVFPKSQAGRCYHAAASSSIKS